jgi:hypothetical protein
MAISSLNVLVADEYTKVTADGITVGGNLQPASRGVSLWGGGGEVVSFQLVLDATATALKNIALEFEPLAGEEGPPIPPRHFDTYLVGFVRTPSVVYASRKPSAWRPDPLFPFYPFDVLDGDMQPVWVNLRIPRNHCGRFLGRVIVHARGKKSARIPIRLKVWNFALPRKTKLVNMFDFGIADKLSGFEKLYGPVNGDGFAPFERFMRYLVDHGVNRLMYGHFLSGGLLGIKQQNGRYRCDLSRAKTILELMAKLKLGFNHWPGPIWSDPSVFFKIYSMYERFGRLGDNVFHDDDFNRCVVDLATDLYGHLDKLGLSSNTHAYFYDEPIARNERHMALLSRRLKEACPETTQVTAIGSPACIRRILKKDLPIDVVCGHLTFYDAKLHAQLVESGREYWWYTSNWWEPRGSHISFWIDEPALHHRILYWLTWRYGVPGFGYWNTNVWNYRSYDDNVDAGRRMEWPYSNWNVANNGAGSGDGQLVYPGSNGPIGSMRFEAIRHGWQDHACLTLLETRLKKLRGSRRSSLEQFIAQTKQRVGTLKNFTRNTNAIKNIRHQVGKRLSTLTEKN